MVSSLLVDTINDPTAQLLELYASSGSDPNFPQIATRHFSEIFNTRNALQEVPILNLHFPPEVHRHRSLVRFRGMIQDTSISPEMYVAKLPDGSCGGWGLMHELENKKYYDGDFDYSHFRECTVVWAVSVPGETDWYAAELDGVTYDHSVPQSSNTQPHKYPSPLQAHVGVQVKVYDTDNEVLKPTDVTTFIGILTTESLCSELTDPVDVPTLHVLCTVDNSHVDSQPYPSPDADKICEELLTWIADEALGGDRITAQWLLLAVLARVQSRTPPIIPPSLTISHFPLPSTDGPSTPTISPLLKFLLPSHQTLPLSLDLLNAENFSPESKDEDLYAGRLQVPQGSKFIITESGISEGKLMDKGVLNVRAMQEVMVSQSLSYIFPFSQYAFPTDIGFVILSQGKKSAFFQTTFTIPYQPQEDTTLYKPPELIRLPPRDKLASFRALILGAMRRTVAVGDETAEYIQNAFVSERQKDKSMSAEDLIQRMTLARLMALSLHRPNVSIEIWDSVTALEQARKARLA